MSAAGGSRRGGGGAGGGARAAAGAGAGALAGAGAACVTRISGAHVPVTKKAEINDTLGIDELLRRSPAD